MHLETDAPAEPEEQLLGVPRPLLVERALGQLPPAMRGMVDDLRFAPGGRFLHMGMVFDTLTWRVTWREPGLPEATGAIPVWNGVPV
jgi:hypothetical protein